MASGSWTTTITGDWAPIPVGAQVPASKMASSSSGLICSGRNFRMLRRSLSTRSVSLVIGTRFLSLSKSSP